MIAHPSAAELALQASEERLRMLFDAMDEGFCLVEQVGEPSTRPTDFRFLAINRAFEGQAGLQNAVGNTMRELLPSLEDYWFERYTRVAETGVSVRFENEAKPLGRWFEVSASRIPNARPPQVAIVFTDITARRRAQDERTQLLAREQALNEQLRRSDAVYRTLFESIDQGFALLDVLYDENDRPIDYRYLQVNEAFAAHSGLTDAVGKTIRELVGHIEPFWPELYGRVVATGEPQRVENRVEQMGRWFDVHASRVGPAEQRQVVVLFSDITERKTMELERERLLGLETDARELAEEASLLKDEFLATISHELRTPLNSILGWVQMLRGGTLPADRTARALETIERNARAQARLIEDLLDMSRIVSGKLGLDVQPVELSTIVEAAIESIRPAAEVKSIQLVSRLEPCGMVTGDPNRLQQVAWNLLTNAVKFTPRGGRVRVEIECIDSIVALTVSDTGQGIASDFLPYVFERFRQAEGGTTRLKGGLGLGLSIVKQLVEMHGGTIRARSDGEDKGASFTVCLPVSAAPRRALHGSIRPEANAEAVAVIGERRLEGMQLLVVDDEDDTREMLIAMLETNGAAVAQASSAAEGRAAFAAAPPDVLVSDIGMPGDNGYSFIASIRALSADEGGKVPAVALTAYARSEDRTKALSAGFSSHVAKPVEAEELVAVIASLARDSR